MHLADYLKQFGVTTVALAAKTGLSNASISRIARGVQAPSLRTLKKLKAATKGMVTADAFLERR